MNTSPYVDPHKSGHAIWEEFSMSFTPAVREVVEFAKRIPGFRELSQHDQISLLKAGTFEVCTSQMFFLWYWNTFRLLPDRCSDTGGFKLLVHLFICLCFVFLGQVLVVRFASLFDVKERTVTFLSGKKYSVETLCSMGAGDLLNSMLDFSEKLRALNLSEEEMSLFTAVVLVSAGTIYMLLFILSSMPTSIHTPIRKNDLCSSSTGRRLVTVRVPINRQ